MIKCWRPLLLAAVLTGTVCVGGASAQTVAITSAPAGAKIDVEIVQTSGVTTGAATADPEGIATVAMNLQGKLSASGMDASIFVDTCAATRRILIVERGAQLPPPGEGCERRDVSGLYWVRPVNTIVVNVAGLTPTVLLIKGSYTPRPPNEPEPPRTRRLAPTGLTFFGGAGLLNFANATSTACGNVAACAGDQSGLGFAIGGVYWITRYVGLEGSYLRPPKATASSDAVPLHFKNTLDVDVVRIAGNVGVPIGPVRLYGLVGGSFHQASSSSTETIDPTTVTVNDLPQTVPGGTQAFGLRTEGWGLALAGGLEVWPSNRFALYGEMGLSPVKGKATGGGEGTIDDHVTSLTMGVRLRIGRR